MNSGALSAEHAMPLTDRQQRERVEYNRRVERQRTTVVDFEHFSQKRFGPWNPYWFADNYVLEHFAPESTKLLSYGCGRGEQALRFAKHGYKVCGFDISDKNIENANELAAKYGLERTVSFTIQPAERLNYPSDHFDVIIGENILHHIDLNEAVPEIRRILKPGGCAVFKDSLNTPLRACIRNSWLVTWLCPKGTKNLVRGQKYNNTKDETPLTKRSLAIMRAEFPDLTMHRFRVVAILETLIGNRPLLERCDWLLFRLAPFFRGLGDNVVLIVKKP